MVRDNLAEVPAFAYRAVLVGQAPSRGSDPRRPLTGGRSGTFLRGLAGLSLRGYVEAFERSNLLGAWPGPAPSGKGDAFPIAIARAAADAEVARLAGRRVLFLGRGVLRAFGAGEEPPLRWFDHRGFTAACVPHPSGVNIWWNDERHRRDAERFFRDLLADVDVARHGLRA